MSNSSIIARNQSLADAVAERIRSDIFSGVYAIGDRLPTEREFSETYGVSRPIVREAVGCLKRDGLISTRQGLGAFVIQTHELAFRLNGADLDDADDIRNVVELLMAVESAATGLAAERRTKPELTEIKNRLNAMQQAIDRGDDGVEEDIAFHRTIVQATKNPYFRQMSEFLDTRIRNFIRKARTNTARKYKERIQAVQEEHSAIYDAIASGDGPNARLAAETHLLKAAERLALYLKKA
jgi:GntR family transcriptional regulator, transcriptional repressor for pyruvate dehydrogenase complex